MADEIRLLQVHRTQERQDPTVTNYLNTGCRGQRRGQLQPGIDINDVETLERSLALIVIQRTISKAIVYGKDIC